MVKTLGMLNYLKKNPQNSPFKREINGDLTIERRKIHTHTHTRTYDENRGWQSQNNLHHQLCRTKTRPYNIEQNSMCCTVGLCWFCIINQAMYTRPVPTMLYHKVKSICLPCRRPVFLCSILGLEDPLEKGMATHSRVLAQRIPWTVEPGGLQSMGSQRVRHD